MLVTDLADAPAETSSRAALAWIQMIPPEPGQSPAPYFMTEDGQRWAPIGQNDSISWPELKGLFRRKDLASAERYLDLLAAHGVTVLRLMMEYAQFTSRYFERPVGRYQPDMVIRTTRRTAGRVRSVPGFCCARKHANLSKRVLRLRRSVGAEAARCSPGICGTRFTRHMPGTAPSASVISSPI
jgi:hypothetical protein